MTTDDQGRFSFTGLPAGRYNLTASRPGHITATYGQRQPGRPGTMIQLSEKQAFQANLQIPRGSVITGTVLDENGEPAPQTPVRVSRIVTTNGQKRLQGQNSGSTDDRGIYRVFGLLPGEYVICATPRNTVTGELDRMRQEIQGLEVALAQAARDNQEQARFMRERIASLADTIAQTPDEGPAPGYAPICYPGSISTTNAATVPLGIGEERAGIDLQLQLAPLARVEGSVINSSGAPLNAMNVQLNELNPLGPAMQSFSARADSEGRFRLQNVPPGQYRLSARATIQSPRTGQSAPSGRGAASSPSAPPLPPAALWASTDIVVDGRHLSNVMLTLQPGLSISGQVNFEGATAAPTDLTRLRVSLSPMEPGMPGGTSGRVDASGRFTIANVVPGRYRLTAGGAAGWFVESASIGGQDALDFPFEVKGNQSMGGAQITFTDQQTEVTGVVTDGSNQPVVDYTLVMFPADERYWSGTSRRVQSARPSTDGRFTFRGLPPGDYRLAPVLDPEPGMTSDPAFLQQLEATSIQITLQRGEKKIQDFRLR